ncbi:hypothetical protein PPERSA_08899 [Pseudocohnilembus persalinus]|uniref:Iron-binding zinc finger CDGSH type domain-containing protein n=1 Tax=Pseudocohnilembus persalinus TaxID=266149 RepID=A0A0V0R2U4_PSEPJ|nr:hypothetical protein PPERSA_08899 [Pseudocohnilembus persalinus]|eukprot:KRX08795.1 hypothetical protein PPERSA_08899 [Pseudocohnilembus persalinus]
MTNMKTIRKSNYLDEENMDQNDFTYNLKKLQNKTNMDKMKTYNNLKIYKTNYKIGGQKIDQQDNPQIENQNKETNNYKKTINIINSHISSKYKIYTDDQSSSLSEEKKTECTTQSNYESDQANNFDMNNGNQSFIDNLSLIEDGQNGCRNSRIVNKDDDYYFQIESSLRQHSLNKRHPQQILFKQQKQRSNSFPTTENTTERKNMNVNQVLKKKKKKISKQNKQQIQSLNDSKQQKNIKQLTEQQQQHLKRKDEQVNELNNIFEKFKICDEEYNEEPNNKNNSNQIFLHQNSTDNNQQEGINSFHTLENSQVINKNLNGFSEQNDKLYLEYEEIEEQYIQVKDSQQDTEKDNNQSNNLFIMQITNNSQILANVQEAAKYQRISPIRYEGEAHLHDPYIPAPQILKPPAPRQDKNDDDITDFPTYKNVPIMESIPYREGQYRPPSIPFIGGFYPYNMYLQQGKVYSWCACGISQNSPWCDSLCNYTVTRNRPVQFNVSTAGYYKICTCKFSADAPFCNGTHKLLVRYHHQTHRGFAEIQGEIFFFVGWAYILWNFYT